MASTQIVAARRGSRRDFHAERVRRRTLSRIILLAVFLFAGAALVLAAMSLIGR